MNLQNLGFSSEPVRVVVSRGHDESEHLIDVAVVREDEVVAHFGDPDRDVIPRSAIKPIQVLPLVRTGAAEAYDLSDEEIALAAASHSSEPRHIERVDAWLDRIGLDRSALECGASRPFTLHVADEMLRAGEPFTPIHNCCSGKHVGFLTIARHLGVDPTGYIERDHPVQQLVTEVEEEFTGIDLGTSSNGIDGCGIPTFALPLHSLARAMARLVSPEHLGSSTVAASHRVVRALAANPYWMSGTDRRELQLASAAKEQLITKTGAEGMFTGALPERGIGVALKVRDGATRASELAIAAVLEHLGAIPSGHAVSDVVNAAGTVVGTMQVDIP